MPDTIPRAILCDFSKLENIGSELRYRPISFEGYPTCTFEANNRGHLADITPSQISNFPNHPIYITNLLHNDENHSTIFEGNLMANDREEVPVIVKFAPEEDLVSEAAVYEEFLPLQGRLVPSFFGLYIGRDTERVKIHCIVLQRWGSSLQQRFESLKVSEHARILHILYQLHQAGIAPRDFAERNVLVKDGDYMLIDFENCARHKCQWSYDFSERTDAPREADMRRLEDECEWLFYDATDSGFWDRDLVYFNGRTWRDPHLPNQHVIDKLSLPRSFFEYKTPPKYTATELDKQFWAYRYYRHVKKLMDRGETLESLVKQKAVMFEQMRRKCRKDQGYRHVPRLRKEVDLKTGKYEFMDCPGERRPDTDEQFMY